MPTDFYCDQVLNRKTAVEVLEETDEVLAFYHTWPTWDIHIVVIPKQHITSLHAVEGSLIYQQIFVVIQRIIIRLQLHKSNYKVIVNGGDYQSTQHLHFHLV
jgi:histidine triad (HIT) family protein